MGEELGLRDEDEGELELDRPVVRGFAVEEDEGDPPKADGDRPAGD